MQDHLFQNLCIFVVCGHDVYTFWLTNPTNNMAVDLPLKKSSQELILDSEGQ